MNRLAATLITILGLSVPSAAANLAITAQPYMTGGLFTNPLLPKEDQEVSIIVRAQCTGTLDADPKAALSIKTDDGETVAAETISLSRRDGLAEATYTWSSDQNGLYTVRVDLDPDNEVVEDDENDNSAELTLPVVVKGKGATCISLGTVSMRTAAGAPA